MAELDLREMVLKLSVEMEKVKAENVELREAIVARDERIAALERELRRNSTNSSAPPSSDPPTVKKPKKARTGKKRGAQPGHKGNARTRVAAERVDNFVRCSVSGPCPHCGSDDIRSVHVSESRQVFELPKLAPIVTQFDIESGRCGGCHRRRRAVLNADVPAGCLGPQAQALVATLTGTFQLSRRDAERFFGEVLGIDISLGTISNTEAIVSDALAPAQKEALTHVRHAPVKGVDETGHKNAGERSTTWIGTTPEVAAFRVGVHRDTDALIALLGDNPLGVVNTDRYAVYNILHREQRQLCWAHMRRTFKALIEEGGDAERVGRRLLDNTKGVLRAVREHRAGQIDDDELHRRVEGSRSEMNWLLYDNKHLTGLQTLLEAFVLSPESVWLFTTRADVEPTNNMAERDLRRFVMWRRRSFGSRSERGDRFMERICTVVASIRKQGRELFRFVVDALTAHRLGQDAPPLIALRLPGA